MNILQLIGAIASLIAIVTGAAKLVQWLRGIGEKLKAYVSWNAFQMPPEVETKLSEQHEAVKEAFATYDRDHVGKRDASEVSRCVEDLQWRIEHKLLKQLPFELRSLYGIWVAKIKNRSRKKCVDINLRLPGAVYASVKHDREVEPKALKVAGVIHLGELRPGGECEVAAWTDSYLGDWKYSEVALSRESGVGSVHGEWRNDRLTNLLGLVLKLSWPAFLLLAILWSALNAIPFLTDRANHPTQSAIETLNESYEEFTRGYLLLDGRDREQEKYIDNADRKQVVWDVVFDGANTYPDNILLSFRPDQRYSPSQIASLPLDQGDRIFSLRHGDRIRLRGQLKKISPRMLQLQCSDFELLGPSKSPIPSPTTAQGPSSD